jgi:hypothetical protein
MAQGIFTGYNPSLPGGRGPGDSCNTWNKDRSESAEFSRTCEDGIQLIAAYLRAKPRPDKPEGSFSGTWVRLYAVFDG